MKQKIGKTCLFFPGVRTRRQNRQSAIKIEGYIYSYKHLALSVSSQNGSGGVIHNG